MNIDGVVHSVTSDISGYEKNIKRLEALETKQAKLTEKFNDDSIKYDTKIIQSKKKIEDMERAWIALEKDKSEESKKAFKEVTDELNKEEEALVKLRKSREVNENLYQGRLKRTQKEIEKVRESTTKVAEAVESFSKKLLTLTAPLGVIGAVGLKNWGTQEAALIKMQAALESNGVSVAEYGKEMERLASDIQKLSVVGDEVILKNIAYATSLGVSADKMDEVQRGAVGLSRAFDMELSTATKALANAIYGNFESLQRYIPELKSAETQSEKMDILNKRLASSWKIAQAETSTFNGAITQAKNLLYDAGEQIGEQLAPAIIMLSKSLSGLLNWFNGLNSDTKRWIVTTGVLAASLPILAKGVIIAKTAFIALKASIISTAAAANTLKIALVKTGLGALVVGLGYALSYCFDSACDFEEGLSDCTFSLEELNVAIDDSTFSLDGHTKSIDANNGSLKERLELIKKNHEAQLEETLACIDRVKAMGELDKKLIESRRQYLSDDEKVSLLMTEILAIENAMPKFGEKGLGSEEHLKMYDSVISKTIELEQLQKKILANEEKEAKATEAKNKAEAKRVEAEAKATEAKNKAEQMRFATAQEEYKIKLQMQILERTLSKEEFAKLKIQERALELVKQKLLSEEEALKFAKLEAKLKNPKSDKIVYDKESVNKARKILDSGKAGKRTLEQAQQIVNGEEIDYKNRVGVFSKIKGQRESDNFGDLKNLPTSLGTWGTPVQPVTVSKSNEEQIKGGAVSLRDLKDILGDIHNDIKGIPDTLREVLNG